MGGEIPVHGVRRLKRIGMVAKNAGRTADLLWSVFGIGPFRPYDMVHQQSDAAPERLSDGRWLADCNTLGIELNEQTDRALEYAGFVASRGEGFHHLLFDVNDYDDTIATFARCGCRVIADGGESRSGRQWTLIDTFGLLGWYVKIQTGDDGAGRGGGAPIGPGSATDALEPGKRPLVELGQPAQVGLVVRDGAHTAELLGTLLGIGPFRFLEWPFAGRADMVGFYDGKPGRFRMRLGFASLGGMEIELLQPLEGENVYSDFLAEKGEGLHHLLFEVADVDAKLARLGEIGIGVKMWGTARQPGARWIYLDTVPMLGWSVELRDKVEGAGQPGNKP